MTEQEFLEIVSLHVETWHKPAVKNKVRSWDDEVFGGLKKRSGKLLKEINLDDCILEKWVEGGLDGGNCWNEGDHYPISGEKEPPFTELDNILEQVCPKITYLEYRKLLCGLTPELIEYDSHTVGEYYGNYTTYGYKKVVLRRLWERLKGLGLV